MVLLLVMLSAVINGCEKAVPVEGKKPTLVLFVAASLRDVVQELGKTFEQDHKVELVYNLAGSNTLAQQIKASPSADVFLSADVRWVDFLEQADRILSDSRRNFLSNGLVLISRHDTEFAITDPLQLQNADFKFLALANPEAVPAGRYAKAFLQAVSVANQSLWDIVREKVTPTLDVRAALALVESDPTIVGIVYRTDAATSTSIKVLYEVPPALHPTITYCAAAVKGRSEPDLARAFLDFLGSEGATVIYKKYGFVTS